MTGLAQSNPGKEWQDCITRCWSCRTECQKIFFTHGLAEAGPRVALDHARILMDCIELCQTAADSMVRRSPVYAAILAACASVCEACAEACEAADGPELQHLAVECRAAALACRSVSLGGTGEPAVSLPPETAGEAYPH